MCSLSCNLTYTHTWLQTTASPALQMDGPCPFIITVLVSTFTNVLKYILCSRSLHTKLSVSMGVGRSTFPVCWMHTLDSQMLKMPQGQRAQAYTTLFPPEPRQSLLDFLIHPSRGMSVLRKESHVAIVV